jgi:hypothetical protein
VITNIRQVHEAHQRFIRSNARLVDETSELAARYAEHEVEHNPPFTPRSGRLQKSVDAKWVRTARGNLVKVTSNGRVAPYNLAIEHGTKPHRIEARRGRALRFVWHGTVTFRRGVNHPGTKPYYFLRAATYAAGHLLETRLRLGMATLAKRF